MDTLAIAEVTTMTGIHAIEIDMSAPIKEDLGVASSEYLEGKLFTHPVKSVNFAAEYGGIHGWQCRQARQKRNVFYRVLRVVGRKCRLRRFRRCRNLRRRRLTP